MAPLVGTRCDDGAPARGGKGGVDRGAAGIAGGEGAAGALTPMGARTPPPMSGGATAPGAGPAIPIIVALPTFFGGTPPAFGIIGAGIGAGVATGIAGGGFVMGDGRLLGRSVGAPVATVRAPSSSSQGFSSSWASVGFSLLSLKR